MSRRLAQSLIADGLVRSIDVEEALQRQVVFGGSLDTNLLEAGVIAESELIAAIGRAFALPPVGKEGIDGIGPHIARLFPLPFAETYHMVPYRLEGDTLSVLVNGTPDGQLFDRIHERLKLKLAPAVTTEVRLHYAMNQMYGAGLLPRFRALLSKLDGNMVVTEPASVLVSSDVLSWGVSRANVGAPAGRAQVSLRELLASMELASDRDTVVEILLQAAVVFFDFVGLFLVHGETILGWRGTDPASTSRIARISLPLELPSVFQTIYATRSHYLGPLPQNSINSTLLDDLGRRPPRAALLAPIAVGERLAMILMADNGLRGISPKRVAAMLMLTQRAGLALERLIRRRKAQTAEMLTHGGEVELDEADLEYVASPGSAQLGSDEHEISERDFELITEGEVAAGGSDGGQARDQAPESDSYVAFADVSDDAADSLDDWQDVALEYSAGPTAQAAVKRPASPGVTWEHVIAEAEAAARIAPRAPARIEVAGTVIDERELWLDSLEADDPRTRKDAIDKLVALGSVMDETLRQRFPGRIDFDPLDAKTRVPAFARSSGLCELLALRNADAAPIVLPHLESPDARKRFFAIYYLLSVRYPDAIEMLARRLHDSEPRNRYLAAEALRAYVREEGYRRVVEGTRDQLKVPVVETQLTAVQILGQLRDAGSVPHLIPLVVAPNRELATAAASSLAVICAQGFRFDVAKWAEWWQQSYSRPRANWLLDGLRHADATIRRVANHELQLISGRSTGFDADATPEQRDGPTRLWEAWWGQANSEKAPQATRASA